MARARERAPGRSAGKSRSRRRDPVVLTTKLHPPAGRREHVSRPALVARLASARPGQLTVVSAPAGWGKTTLVADWYASEARERPIAWLSLDAADNDPVRFLAYVVEALRRVVPELGKGAQSLLDAPGSTFLEVMVPALVGDLEALPAPVALVLEDYHAITSREIHEGVAFLVEHLPPTLALVIVTRLDPSLPLARLRARGDLTEIRADELRFSVTETASFLNDALRLGLDDRQVARLHGRTEGWAAGLYLAALSLRGRPDADAFITAFAGDDRHVVDYLAVEVLGNQPEELRSFLVRTSILDRLSGPLCDAVTEGSGSARVLAQMERSNLFVVPLDTRRRWYRYHRLFATLLRRELDETEPELVATLHRRAAAWHGSHGAADEEIRHVLAAGDVDEGRELVAGRWTEYFNRGRLATVSGWLDELSDEAVLGDPALCIPRAWILLDRGRIDEAGRWIDAAFQGRDADVERGAAILRAVHLFKTGDADAANRAARAVLELGGSDQLFSAMVAHCLLGITFFLTGRVDEAATALEEAVRRAEATENQLGRMYALGYLALVHAERGESEQAERRAAAAASLGDERGRSEHFVAMMAQLAHGRALAEQGKLRDAANALERATRLSSRGAGRLEIAYALIALADVRHALGDRAEAVRLVRDAERTLAACPDPGVLRELLARTERRLGLVEPGRAAAAPAPGELTDRELAVLRLLATDLSRREIAEALFVTLNTVKTHTRGIFRKLGVSSRAEARERAQALGLL